MQTQAAGGWWQCRTLVVTTADGTEYGFGGKVDNWQTYLTGALAARGRDVRGTVDGITIAPWPSCGPG